MSKRQEVNLYLPQLRPRRDYLSAPMAFGGIGVLLLVMLLVGLGMHFNNRSLAAQIQQEQQVVSSLQQQVEEIQQHLPKSHAAQLDVEIVALREQIARRKAVGQLIDGKSIGNTKGFSRQLTSLAQSVTGDISLTGFELLDGGARVAVEGNTRSPQAVPRYVEALRETPSFKTAVFGSLRMDRQAATGLMTFTLNKTDGVDGRAD